VPLHRSSPPANAAVLGVDPGRRVGLAWVDAGGALLQHGVVEVDALAQRLPAADPNACPVALGDGTGAEKLAATLRALGYRVNLVAEAGSSEAARRLYHQSVPARGWWRLVPVGMRPPPADLDAYAAWVIARRYLGFSDAGS
jgi:hypothetical protein